MSHHFETTSGMLITPHNKTWLSLNQAGGGCDHICISAVNWTLKNQLVQCS